MTRSVRATWIACLLLAAVAPTASAADFASTLCAALHDVLPTVQGARPEGVRAQLVMKIVNDFDYDPTELARVRREIDAATTASCPELRTRALALAGTDTLAEAVR